MDNREAYDRPEVVSAYLEDRVLQPAEITLFERYLAGVRSVLDLGVGGGRTTPFLSPGREYVGLDYAPGMIEACRRRFPGLDFRVGDASDLGWAGDGSFGAVVFSYNGFDYLDDAGRRRCLEEVARVLTVGGPFIFSRHDPFGGRGRRRLLRAARLWRGAGYWMDPVHGGLRTHFATPAHVRRDLADVGLTLTEVMPAGPGRRPAWWYYAARA